MAYELELRPIHSLTKVYPDVCPEGAIDHLSAMRNERLSYQVAYKLRSDYGEFTRLGVHLEGDLAPYATARAVGLVPAEMPAYLSADEHYERKQPGLFPDPLYPIEDTGLSIRDAIGWRSIWVSLDGDRRELPVGAHGLTVVFTDLERGGIELARTSIDIRVIDAALPAQTLTYTCWLHADCICEAYGIEPFSDAFWLRLDQFFAAAARGGQNAILTPLVTLPLDTAVGHERLTVQLVDIKRVGDAYTFGFDKLARWVELATKNGLHTIEIAHLFTQWGAAHAPKVMAEVDGETRRIFGWDTDATGEDYATFLRAMLGAFRTWAEGAGILSRCIFHVSDEPSSEHKAAYLAARDLFLSAIGDDAKLYDAISDVEYYKQDIIRHPVPATNHIESFLDADIPGLWAYHCCSQGVDVANRFMGMPSYRNRILGVQLYKYHIAGFLQWGFNFYHSVYSLKVIDPFRTTDACAGFPAGDPFIVYPGPDGPIESLRLLVLEQGFQDMRACQMLEAAKGYDFVMNLIEGDLDEKIRFDAYPHTAAYLLNLRERLYAEIEKTL